MISTPNTELKLGDFKINLSKKIGSGAFGEVYSGKKLVFNLII